MGFVGWGVLGGGAPFRDQEGGQGHWGRHGKEGAASTASLTASQQVDLQCQHHNVSILVLAQRPVIVTA